MMPNNAGWERHIQSLAVAAILGVMGWSAIQLQQLNSQMARLDEKLTAFQSLAANRAEVIQRHEEDIQDIFIRLDRLERE